MLCSRRGFCWHHSSSFLVGNGQQEVVAPEVENRGSASQQGDRLCQYSVPQGCQIGFMSPSPHPTPSRISKDQAVCQGYS